MAHQETRVALLGPGRLHHRLRRENVLVMDEEFGWPGPASVWQPPDELQSPSKVIEFNLAIAMLASEYLDSELAEKVGLFVAERSRLNSWFQLEVKTSGRSTGELLELVNVGREQARNIYPAWQRFMATVSRGLGGEDVRDEMAVARSAVASALDASVSNLRIARDAG